MAVRGETEESLHSRDECNIRTVYGENSAYDDKTAWNYRYNILNCKKYAYILNHSHAEILIYNIIMQKNQQLFLSFPNRIKSRIPFEAKM